jgi:glucans biosynthesis protein
MSMRLLPTPPAFFSPNAFGCTQIRMGLLLAGIVLSHGNGFSAEAPELTRPDTLTVPRSGPTPAQPANSTDKAAAFDFVQVESMARDYAASPYVSHLGEAGTYYKNLGYDQYTDIRYEKQKALWRDLGLPFEIEFFHPGSLFAKTVTINEIVDGQAAPIPFRTENFDYGKYLTIPPGTPPPPGFAGFRAHYNLNSATYKDEVVAFLGPTYFRAVGQHQNYGLSARALAIDTGLPTDEEFPNFEQFWLVRPAPGATSLVIYALLNSPSVAGAYRFKVHPGTDTVMDVASTLYFRKTVNRVGLAPLSSMYWFGENSLTRPPDWRPMVHDSDGLLMANRASPILWQWRPLDVSPYPRFSDYPQKELTGFGLLQRQRRYTDYLDLEALYHQRPSAWVEAQGDWGTGTVQLLELTPLKEFNDNVVAFWTPYTPPPVGEPWKWQYRLHWSAQAPEPAAVSRVLSTRRGRSLDNDDYYFIIEFDRPPSNGPSSPVPEAEWQMGPGALLRDYHVTANPDTGGWRVALRVRFQPGATSAELKCQLYVHGSPMSEQWIYLWTPTP